jgi:histidinol-phosphate/aromatic aminotransferase/cobyric acid decarboxylase-like protein/CTP:molybdopterin cytidylyltransferase MocA
MKAIILTAGYGRRMRPLTNDTHKTLLKVDGREILFRIVDGLVENNVRDLVIVTGHKAKEMKEALLKEYPKLNFQFIHNEVYETTNNIYSMALAFEHMTIDSDILLIESDLVCEPAVFKRIVETPYETAALVDKYRTGMDGTVVSIKEGRINNVFLPHNQDENFNFKDKYKTLNIYKFSQEFCNKTFKNLLMYYAKTIDDNCYYELILGILIYLQKEEVHAEIIDQEKWAEVDDPNDLKNTEFLFSQNKKLEILAESFGGYWTYDILDFCFIRNMYFPTSSILSEIKNNSAALMFNYGSKQKVLDRKLSYFTEYQEKNLLLLNGASQAYPILKNILSGKKALVPTPSFGEYDHLFSAKETYTDLGSVDLADVDRKAQGCEILLFVNPNNPTGTVVPTSVILEMAKKYPNKQVIVDESFIEFSNEKSIIPFVEEQALQNVLVIKSLSKSLGVPGVRLGYVHTCNEKLHQAIASQIPIWNINSFAEFYVEILLKHKNTLAKSFQRTVKDREAFSDSLKTVPAVKKVFPSGANFVLVELNKGVSADALSRALIRDEKIYIKDISSKFKALGQTNDFLRLAVRTPTENRDLVQAMTKHLH